VYNRIAAALNRALVPLVLRALACLLPVIGRRRAAPKSTAVTWANVKGHVHVVAPLASRPTAGWGRAPEISTPFWGRPYVAAMTTGAFTLCRCLRIVVPPVLLRWTSCRPDPRSPEERAAQRQRRWALWLALHGIDAEPLRVHGMGIAS
jgi:hypothetical protein